MKFCPSCLKYKDSNQFRPKTTVPGEFYKNCDSCVRMGFAKRAKAQALRQEYKELREKAVSLRKFDDKAVVGLLEQKQSGKTVATLASENSVSNKTIYKALRRAKVLTTQKA